MVKTIKRDVQSLRAKRPSLTKLRPISRIKTPKSPTVSIPTNLAANIKVVVRVRPPNEKEQGDNSRNVIQVVDNNMLIFDPKEESKAFFYQGVQQKHRDILKKANKHLEFMFDRVFDPTTTNEAIFQETTLSLIESLMNGYNCSVFAYGATGAGKTYTMTGSSQTPGITFQTMVELFRHKAELSEERDFDLGITYVEVYNELVQDLLNPGPALHLREDNKYGVIVAGVKVHKIVEVDELFKLLEEGNKNRTQHPTDANAESSRSHAVFQVYLQMKFKATSEVRTAKLSMIDLAGSERASATGCVGARFTEGANINKSLLALGNCINSLADGHRHIPYRDSKLTRLLKDSLGGNCRTVMIANVSPSSLSYEDTYNTLKYATRAKKIKSVLKKNILNVELHVGNYIEMVAQLKKEVLLLKTKLNEEKDKVATLEQQLKQKKTVTNVKTEVKTNKKVEPVTTSTEFNSTFVKKENNVDQKVQLNENLEKKMKKIFNLRRVGLERCHLIEVSELCANLRRQMKKEADSRMSDICTGTPTMKIDAHKRLGEIVDRFQRKEDALKEEIHLLKLSEKEYEDDLKQMLTEEPQLQPLYNIESVKFELLRSKHNLRLKEKENEIIRDDNLKKNDLICKMANMIKKYHYSLAGNDCLTEDMQQVYEEFVKEYEGRRNIRWMDITSTTDSGLSSTTSLETVQDPIEKENIQILLNKEENSTPLDNTFTLNTTKSPRKSPNMLAPKAYAENIVTQVYKNIPNATRSNKVLVISPRYKELSKKRFEPSTTSAGNSHKSASVAVIKKPPFRTY